MNAMIVAPRTTDWHRLKSLVLDSVCFDYEGCYKLGLDENGPAGPDAPRPSPDLVAAVQVVSAIDPNVMGTHCDSLKRRVEKLGNTAEALSKRATLLSEGVVLTGTCDFLKEG